MEVSVSGDLLLIFRRRLPHHGPSAAIRQLGDNVDGLGTSTHSNSPCRRDLLATNQVIAATVALIDTMGMSPPVTPRRYRCPGSPARQLFASP